jgi:hypothetical protein
VLPKGPLQPDGKTLAFTSGVCIYLPPNYTRGHLRYPVLYLLHGGGGDAADWVTFGHIRSIMDGMAEADPSRAAIVVMPDGTDAQWYDGIDARSAGSVIPSTRPPMCTATPRSISSGTSTASTSPSTSAPTAART